MIVPKVYTEVIYYVLLPIFVIIFVFGLAIIITSFKDRKSEEADHQRRFKIDYWSAIIGIILGALLFTVSIGFSIAFIENLVRLELVGRYPWVVALLCIFPLVPLSFLIYCLVKLVKTLKKRNEIIVEVE